MESKRFLQNLLPDGRCYKDSNTHLLEETTGHLWFVREHSREEGSRMSQFPHQSAYHTPGQQVMAAQHQQSVKLSPRFSLGSPLLTKRSKGSTALSSSWKEGRINGYDGRLYSVQYQDGEVQVLNESEVMDGVYSFRKRASRMEDEEEQEASFSSSFTERIELILKRHSMREEAHESVGSTLFTPAEMTELSLLCAQQTTITSRSSQAEGFAGVEGDTLTSLVLILQKHVHEAESLDLFQIASQLYQRHGQSAEAMQKVSPPFCQCQDENATAKS